MISEDITFTAGAETLAGTIDWNAKRDKPTILSLHGGGDGARTRIAPITQNLAEAGLSCLRFDHSGQGDSTGEMKKSSLAKRVDEALAATALLDTTRPITIIGTSMGGAVAVELLRRINIGTLILFCPALYAVGAFNVPFDENFSTILRRKDSFTDADLTPLHDFTGGFLHFIGNKDKIIPSGVTYLYETNVPKAAPSDFIMLENAPHTLHSWMNDNTAVRQAVIGMMLDYVKN